MITNCKEWKPFKIIAYSEDIQPKEGLSVFSVITTISDKGMLCPITPPGRHAFFKFVDPVESYEPFLGCPVVFAVYKDKLYAIIGEDKVDLWLLILMDVDAEAENISLETLIDRPGQISDVIAAALGFINLGCKTILIERGMATHPAAVIGATKRLAMDMGVKIKLLVSSMADLKEIALP